MSKTVYNKRSSSVINNAPKLPSPSVMHEGEIAVNFADGYETLSILNNASGIATFSCDNIVYEKVDNKISAATSAISQHIENNLIHLPNPQAGDNGKVLRVVNGEWVITTPLIVYSGDGTPQNSYGKNGDLYMQTDD